MAGGMLKLYGENPLQFSEQNHDTNHVLPPSINGDGVPSRRGDFEASIPNEAVTGNGSLHEVLETRQGRPHRLLNPKRHDGTHRFIHHFADRPCYFVEICLCPDNHRATLDHISAQPFPDFIVAHLSNRGIGQESRIQIFDPSDNFVRAQIGPPLLRPLSRPTFHSPDLPGVERSGAVSDHRPIAAIHLRHNRADTSTHRSLHRDTILSRLPCAIIREQVLRLHSRFQCRTDCCPIVKKCMVQLRAKPRVAAGANVIGCDIAKQRSRD